MESVQEGANFLLKEVVEVLQSFRELKYMVIGGWCPYLRIETSGIHPGTLDVDLLFKESHKSGKLKPFIEAMFAKGFSPSAKHEFQLLKPIKIKNRELLFNVDLLHPLMVDEIGDSMFVNQLDLDIPYDSRGNRIKKMVSIVLKNSAILFEENLFESYDLGGVEFNLISFDGLFLTKMDSCQTIKRPRDSFDIFLGFRANKINLAYIKALAKTDIRINTSLGGFIEYLKKNEEDFNKNIKKFSDKTDVNPARYILSKIE